MSKKERYLLFGAITVGLGLIGFAANGADGAAHGVGFGLVVNGIVILRQG